MFNAKQKGDLLEKIVAQLCSGIKNAKVENNVKLKGRSGTNRQIDTLINGKVGIFDVRILIDPKNYKTPVDIKDVDSIAGMVLDVGANLGVIVCPTGFTDGAKKRAENAGVQLYEIYDQSLGNSDLFIPLRYVEARIDKYHFEFSQNSVENFSLPIDSTRWMFHIDNKVLKPKEVPIYAWNKELIPQKKGNYSVKIGAIKITDAQNKNKTQYCDLNVGIVVVEDYYLKLFPASFIRPAGIPGKESFDLKIDIYSKREDMLKNGWKSFDSMEDMNKAADIENQPIGVRELIIRNIYSIGNLDTSI